MKKLSAAGRCDANLRRSAYLQPNERRSTSHREEVPDAVQMLSLDRASPGRLMGCALLACLVRQLVFLALWVTFGPTWFR